MLRAITGVAAAILVLHGLIHLMGTAAYLGLTEVPGLPYRTALLEGRWEVGAGGMRVFGALWALAALGFVVAAAAWVGGWGGWRLGLAGVTLLSFALTALDWRVAFLGAALDVGILAALSAGPRVEEWLSR